MIAEATNIQQEKIDIDVQTINDLKLKLVEKYPAITKLNYQFAVNQNIVEKNRAIEVDIKREIAISKADINGVTSEEIKGKVMNKKDKLKALRRRNRK